MSALGAEGCWFKSNYSDFYTLKKTMNSMPLFFNYLILLEAFVLSIYWLLDSNFSILLSFTLVYFLFFVVCLYLGYEFLGLIVLLIYSTGITIMFIIGSMIIGGKTLLNLKKEDSGLSTVYKKELTNNFFINFIIYILTIKTFFVFKFSVSPAYRSFLNYLLVDCDSVVLFTALTAFNDSFVLGNLLFCEFSLNTIISGFILLTSLIGSIHVAMISDK